MRSSCRRQGHSGQSNHMQDHGMTAMALIPGALLASTSMLATVQNRDAIVTICTNS